MSQEVRRPSRSWYGWRELRNSMFNPTQLSCHLKVSKNSLNSIEAPSYCLAFWKGGVRNLGKNLPDQERILGEKGLFAFKLFSLTRLNTWGCRVQGGGLGWTAPRDPVRPPPHLNRTPCCPLQPYPLQTGRGSWPLSPREVILYLFMKTVRRPHSVLSHSTSPGVATLHRTSVTWGPCALPQLGQELLWPPKMRCSHLCFGKVRGKMHFDGWPSRISVFQREGLSFLPKKKDHFSGV